MSAPYTFDNQVLYINYTDANGHDCQVMIIPSFGNAQATAEAVRNWIESQGLTEQPPTYQGYWQPGNPEIAAVAAQFADPNTEWSSAVGGESCYFRDWASIYTVLGWTPGSS